MVREKALSVAGVRAGELAVDVGAGTGFIAMGLVENGLRVIAVDPSESMLARLSEKLRGHENVRAFPPAPRSNGSSPTSGCSLPLTPAAGNTR